MLESRDIDLTESLIGGPLLISRRYSADSATHVENFPELHEITKIDIPFANGLIFK